MKFIFECEDEVCLPIAYKLTKELRPFMEKVKDIDLGDVDVKSDKMVLLDKIFENLMEKYPHETAPLLRKLWILEDEEKAPSAFVTIPKIMKTEVAVNFFMDYLPTLIQLYKGVSSVLK